LRLKRYLEAHGINAYRLGQRVEGLSPKTVYMYVNDERTPSLEGLSKVVKALRELTGEEVKVSDVLEYTESSETAPWQTFAGLLDDPAFITAEPGELERNLGEALAREMGA
jgi:hypothetical protein